MANCVDFHGSSIVIDRIDDAIVADSQPPPISLAAQFPTAGRTRRSRKALDSRQDALNDA
jgi:hypothetical protein